MLLEKGLITEDGLGRALVEQRRTGRLLGEILVGRGWVSAADVARALAEQHGLEVKPEGDIHARVDPVLVAENGAVFEVSTAPAADAPLHTSTTFLDAADFAFDLLDTEELELLEIAKISEGEREVVWSYSREAAAEAAATRPSMTDLYGFPADRWDAERHVSWKRSERAS